MGIFTELKSSNCKSKSTYNTFSLVFAIISLIMILIIIIKYCFIVNKSENRF